GAGPFARTNHWKDIRTRSHSQIESRAKSNGTTLATAPNETPAHSQFTNVPRADNPLMRSASILSVSVAVAGLLSLGFALFTAVFEGSHAWVVAFYVGAALFGVASLGFATVGMARDRSVIGTASTLLGSVLALFLLTVLAYGLEAFTR